jgi:methyltransferase (TIGR00027 family)
MQANLPSRTALVTALMRSLHARADPHPIFVDEWGDKLVPDSVRDRIAERAAQETGVAHASRAQAVDAWLHSNPAYARVIARSRYTEDALAAAIAAGTRQYVLVGAGFDSYALRVPANAQDVSIFEIDHPATQTYKLERMAQCGLEPPRRTYFLAADLSLETVEQVLSRSSFDREQPAFFSWLGVTMYLTREANLACLGSIARAAAPGSELVFTYIDQAAFAGDSRESGGVFAEVQRRVASIGEPFLSGFDPSALADELLGLGLQLQEDLGNRQLLRRLDPQGASGLSGDGGYSRIAKARRL